MLVFIYLLNVLTFFVAIKYFWQCLQIYQLRGYVAKRYLRFFSTKKWCLYCLNLSLLIAEILLYYFIEDLNLHFVLGCNLVSFVIFSFFIFSIVKSEKTPIVYTNKMKRLLFICIALLLPVVLSKFGVGTIGVIVMPLPIIANFLNFYDKIKNKNFIKMAQKKLKEINPKIIAITGSNGKTSIKNILCHLLDGKFATCTIASYNTPLGISKFINDNLRGNCKFLILEYGARNRGDVLKLCKLFGADCGVISTIAPQHMETFKSINNIYLAKKELSDFLGEKLCVFNLDNPYTNKMFNEKCGKKLGISLGKKDEANLYASNIKIKDFCTEFEINYMGKSYTANTKLLGKFNVLNILLASALALELGVNIEKILKQIETLKPTPHRLEYVLGAINILDDSYNCSISSAKESLEVLSQLNGKKMVCTPGIIEGGKMQKNLNFSLGQMCACANFVVVVGSVNKYAISSGLVSKNFNKNNLFFAPTLNDAKQHFKLLNANDTLLLLNDLPDDYN